MGTLGWAARSRVEFVDIDQDRTLKWTSILRVLAKGNADTPRGIWPEGARADYVAAHGLQSIVSYFEVTRGPQPPALDGVLELRYVRELGYTLDRRGRSRRYGGVDAGWIIDHAGLPLARMRQHWLWFHPERGEVLGEPAPGFAADEQSTELPLAPTRPNTSWETVAGGRFRWSPRETDLNQHVTFSAYVERAENALADEKVDTTGLTRLEAWFRQPSFLDDAMTTTVESDDDTETVTLVRAESGTLCAVLRWSAAARRDMG
jgi:hypothetical protein